MKTIKMTVSTKKGEAQGLRFLVVQEIPFPSIGSGGRLAWSNCGGLFPSYGPEAEGIGSKFICYLLADPAPEIIPDDYNRTIFAGYADYHDKTKINGGTFRLRGRDLGEMSLRFDGNPQFPEIKVSGFDRPSNSEREAIMKLICPALWQFITDHQAELKAEATAKLKARFAAELNAARKTLDALEAQAAQAVI